MSIFDGCGDSCGWMAAVLAMLCYGTYGVPIKQTVQILPQLHPLILQSYKSVTMFALSWCVLFLGVSVSFTYWGILSGLLWVLGGSGGIVAVRWVGMATAVGTWSSVMILMNVVWSILIFKEPVANLLNTVSAFVLLALGLLGMSCYSSSSTPLSREQTDDDSEINETERDDQSEESSSLLSNSQSDTCERETALSLHRRTRSDDASIEDVYLNIDTEEEAPFDPETHVQIGGKVFCKRDAGIAGALFNGIMTGSSLIPLHYSPLQGADYMISFASGGLIANLVLWVIYYVVLMVRLHDLDVSFACKLRQAASGMPEWHFRQLWIPGFFAGTWLHRVQTLMPATHTYVLTFPKQDCCWQPPCLGVFSRSHI